MEGHTDLFRVDNGILTEIRYQEEIHGPTVRLYAGPVFLLVHNGQPQVVRVCRQFLEDEGIYTTDRPPVSGINSSGLNPIEHLWDIMFRSI